MVTYHCRKCHQEEVGPSIRSGSWLLTIEPDVCRYCTAAETFARLFGTPVGGL